VQFTTEVDSYYRRATHVVTLGGVNTTTEVIAWRLPALILSLGQGEAEQAILLARLARMTSLLTLGAPDCTPLNLVPLLRQLLAARTLRVDARLDCGGAARAVAALQRLWRQGPDPP
jgi:predicted glycosyltransferase